MPLKKISKDKVKFSVFLKKNLNCKDDQNDLRLARDAVKCLDGVLNGLFITLNDGARAALQASKKDLRLNDSHVGLAISNKIRGYLGRRCVAEGTKASSKYTRRLVEYKRDLRRLYREKKSKVGKEFKSGLKALTLELFKNAELTPCGEDVLCKMCDALVVYFEKVASKEVKQYGCLSVALAKHMLNVMLPSTIVNDVHKGSAKLLAVYRNKSPMKTSLKSDKTAVAQGRCTQNRTESNSDVRAKRQRSEDLKKSVKIITKRKPSTRAADANQKRSKVDRKKKPSK